MATTPQTSIGSSYKRLAGPTPVIKQGTAGPELSAATKERLALGEAAKLDDARRDAENRRKQNEYEAMMKKKAADQEAAMRGRYNLQPGQAMTPYQQGQWSAYQDAQRQKDTAAMMQGFKMGNWANRRN